MTGWHVLHLPVYWGDGPGARTVVEGVWPDWEQGLRVTLSLHGGLYTVRTVDLDATVAIRVDGVHLTEASRVDQRPRRWLSEQEASGWIGRPVSLPDGTVIGRVKDCEFRDRDGLVTGLWLSRGILADLWQGFVFVRRDAIRLTSPRIVLAPPGNDED